MKMNIDAIIVNDRLRKVDASKVLELADSIKEIGLLSPIVVTNGNVLVAGSHRLQAYKKLGLKEIEVNRIEVNSLMAELAEIDENLIRNELHYIDRGNHLARRKEIYEELHPETKAGVAGGKASCVCRGTKTESDSVQKPSFVKDTASKTGKSETVIKEEIQIAKKILPEVQEVIRDKDISKTDALKIAKMEPKEQLKVAERIKEEPSKPHVSHNSGNNEWYTPFEYIESARGVMGSIDLDPASCELANKTVNATKYFTFEDDGLKQEWAGNVWMNPPYAGELIGQFCEKLVNSDIEQAIVLVNNATETGWFNTLISKASAVVFPKGRVKFYTPTGQTGAPLQGQAILYIGYNKEKFLAEFRKYGWGASI
jgi:ParB family chromosome partitioning protein